jgi:DNA-directed RNA polymerase specialized sigma24 family protein
MIARSHCDCMVCRLEKDLSGELGHESAKQEFRELSAAVPLLSAFPTPIDLLHHIHAPNPDTHNSCADPLILELIQQNRRFDHQCLCQRILLQLFIPTIHRTTSQVSATFPSLARDDVSQHVICSFLEFLQSRELRTRRSHLAFTIARKLRRSAFRWAIREARGTTSEASGGIATNPAARLSCEESFTATILLHEFLDQCQRVNCLSQEERDLLLQFKLNGLSCRDLASGNGHSAIAIQHRVQRLVDRLRRIARQRTANPPQQLLLFPE